LAFAVERFRRLNTVLVDFIRQTIRAHGPQPFSWFMQQALYHPEHGYYSSGRAEIGRKGDYFTNISVAPLFGHLLCAQFVEIWERLGSIDNFLIVEQAAHDGQFARDVLEFARRRFPEFFASMRYRIIEPFPFWQDRQQQTLASFLEKLEWRTSMELFTGIHFSNELLDAMPIDLPGKFVDVKGDDFLFVDQGAPAFQPPRSFNQSALDWIDDAATNLQRGYILIIDYGHICEDFQPAIQVRAQHRHLDLPFEQIGHADITAHVDWKSIAQRARQDALRIVGFTDQHHFLTGIISRWPDLIESSPDRGALQTLHHPEMLGRSFQILVLEKNVDPRLAKSFGSGAVLAGFKFARATDL
jgi:SAM-dependent MidA family methyltransferase